jgi:hypothetical protein
VTRELSPSSKRIFSKLLHYYDHIVVFAVYLGAISLVLIALAGRSEISSAAMAILMGSTMTAFAAITMAIMFRFSLRGLKPPFQRVGLIVGSISLFLVDLL